MDVSELTLAPMNIIAPNAFDAFCCVEPDILAARARICTPRVDRQNDIIEPSGVDWTDYRFNPVVMFDHGRTGVPFPIAKSEGPDGTLCVNYDSDEDAIYAKSFFTDKHPLSYQMFGLIAEGVLRGTSIHVAPIENGWVSRPNDGHHVYKSSLLEYSWCTVSINPDSYAKSLAATDSKISQALELQLEAANRILTVGKIGSDAILPAIAKCLRAVMPSRQHVVKGHKPEDAMGTKTLTEAEIKSLKPVALAKALATPAEYDAETVQRLTTFAKSMPSDEMGMPKAGCADDSMRKADVPVDDTLLPTPEGSGESTETVDETPMGYQFIADLYDNMTALLDNADKKLKAVENPEIKDGIQPIIDDLRSKLAEIEGICSSCYPEQPALTGASGDEPMDMAKSWLADKRNQFKLVGLAERLNQACGIAGVPAKAKSLLAATSRDLRMLQSKAKSMPAQGETVPKAQFDELQNRYTALRDKTKRLVAKFKGQPADLPT